MIILRVIDGPHAGRAFKFEDHDTFLVGRGSRSNFRLSKMDPAISRSHFLVEVNPPLARLTNLSATNGTKVNGRRVDAADLADGDELRCGHTVLTVGLPHAEPTVPTPDAGHAPADGAGAGATLRPPAPDDAPDDAPDPGTARPALDPASRYTRTVAGVPPRTVDADEVGRGDDADPAAASSVDTVGGYTLVRRLGAGGMGEVFLARRTADGAGGEPVALKLIHPRASGGPRDIERFLREVRVLRDLNHPRVVRYFGFGEDGGRVYLAMEYVPGTDAEGLLADRLARGRGPLPVRPAVGIVRRVLEGLGHLHAAGFVHRDLKPANILLGRAPAPRGGPGRIGAVKLADFGLARVYQASRMSGLTLDGQFGGSFGFLPPEQITDFRGATPAGDLYAAAATLYRLLTARHSHDFPPTVAGRVLAVLHKDPVPLRDRRPDLPAGLADVIHRGLARDPADRWETAAAMRAALKPFG